jgi:hypothetical protein
VGHEGGIFEFLDGLIAWVASIAKLAGKFALKPTPDAESGGVNFIVMRYATNLAIVDVENLGIVAHRRSLVLKPSIDLVPEFYNTGFGKQ